MQQRILWFVLAVLMPAVAVNATWAEIYKWVSKDGVVRYQDQPPPAGVEAEVLVEMPSQPNVDPVAEEKTRPPSSKRIPAKVEGLTPKVEIYMTRWCGYCKKAEKFFATRGIPFVAYDIEKDRQAAQRKRQLTDRGGVPLTVINGQVIYGYSEAAYARALGLKR